MEIEKNRYQGKLERLVKENESLVRDNSKKEEIIRKLNEEKESFKSAADFLKRDLNNNRNNHDKKENELATLQGQLNDCEREKLVKQYIIQLLKRKVANLESLVKNSKFEYENINKIVAQLKKQLVLPS